MNGCIDVKLVEITAMPQDVNEAYTIVSKNYSDQPAKGNAKEFYTLWIEDDKTISDENSTIPLTEYKHEYIKNYIIVAKWLVSVGLNLTNHKIFIHWNW